MKEPKSIEECNYFTKRVLTDENFNEVGKIMVWEFKEEEGILYYKYECPKCGYKGEGRMEWDHSFPIKVVCDRCNFIIELERLNPRVRKKRKKKK